MILLWVLILPFIGGLVAWLSGRIKTTWPRWTSLVTMALHLILVVIIWINHFGKAVPAEHAPWFLDLNLPWLPQTGISFHLAMDGMSLLLVGLTAFLGIMAVVASWTEIRERTGFFHFNLLWCLSGVAGTFLALDLFLFFFFWELMLVPMYFLIALWGHEKSAFAAVKFFIFTQLSGLFMFASVLGLYFAHGQATGQYTFDYAELLGTTLAGEQATLLFLGFFAAFAVKLPAIPFHTWLPDAHTEAPTAGSVILAGLLLKTGAYGFLRFAVPLFPEAAITFAPLAMVLGVVGILYGAALAFAQTDVKRLIAYTSTSHMGYVLLAVAVWNELALQGAIVQMISHGLSTGALFILAGALQERTGTRELNRMGGLWSEAPKLGGAFLFFALASLGLPGLGNFIGEFLILLGAFRVSPSVTALGVLGLIASTIYSLRMVQKVFFGPRNEGRKIPDLTLREMTALLVVMATLLGIGVCPNICIHGAADTVKHLQHFQQPVTAEFESNSLIAVGTDEPFRSLPGQKP